MQINKSALHRREEQGSGVKENSKVSYYTFLQVSIGVRQEYAEGALPLSHSS